jgi:hypothetical protein
MVQVVSVIESTSKLSKVQTRDGEEFWVKCNRVRVIDGQNVLLGDLAARNYEIREQLAAQRDE